MVLRPLILVLWTCVLMAGDSGLSDQAVIDRLTGERPADRAIARGLAWLRAQQLEDGRLNSERHATALTALGLMAQLAAGVSFRDPEHGPWLRRSLTYVLAKQDADGYFGGGDGSRMYGHGICTLLLAEALGMCNDAGLEEQVRAALERAIAVTVAAARVAKNPANRGGWGYQPGDDRSDLSLSGWQVMSLHAAQQVGVAVPGEVIGNALAYAQRLTSADGRVGYTEPGQDNPSLRGLGMLCFAIGHRDSDPLVDRIAQRIERQPLRWEGQWVFYRAYYDAVGLSRARPESWERYGSALETLLSDHQDAAGWWGNPPGGNEGEHGKIYATSMALLALAVNRHVLPAYQR